MSLQVSLAFNIFSHWGTFLDHFPFLFVTYFSISPEDSLLFFCYFVGFSYMQSICSVSYITTVTALERFLGYLEVVKSMLLLQYDGIWQSKWCWYNEIGLNILDSQLPTIAKAYNVSDTMNGFSSASFVKLTRSVVQTNRIVHWQIES